eukprot:714554-Prymnesium_polylepis.1
MTDVWSTPAYGNHSAWSSNVRTRRPVKSHTDTLREDAARAARRARGVRSRDARCDARCDIT